MKQLLAFGMLIAVGAVGVADQTPAPRAPDPNVPVAFEVASVKPNNSGSGGSIRQLPGGRVDVVNMPVRQLVIYAYQVTALTLAGGPAWINTDRFDITAKLAGDAPSLPLGSGPDHAALAMRTLLADRFSLKVRRETRDLDVYALVVVKPGTLGPALKAAGPDCSTQEATRARAANAPPPGGSAVFCGARISSGRLQVGSMPIGGILGIFGGQSGRTVIDRTGLTGAWDFELTYSPVGLAAGTTPADGTAPSFFTALQEQLGLKLEPIRTPIEVLVIDSVDHPTPD